MKVEKKFMSSIPIFDGERSQADNGRDFSDVSTEIIGDCEIISNLIYYNDTGIFDETRTLENSKRVKVNKQSMEINYADFTLVDMNSAKENIISSLNWEDLQIGNPVEAEYIIKTLMAETSSETVMSYLYKFYFENYSNSLFVCTILHALSHMDYEVVYHKGLTMALVSLSYSDERVVSYAIKAFSNWNSKDYLKFLKSSNLKQLWAQRELNRVINYIEVNGDELDGLLNKEDQPAVLDSRSA